MSAGIAPSIFSFRSAKRENGPCAGQKRKGAGPKRIVRFGQMRGCLRAAPRRKFACGSAHRTAFFGLPCREGGASFSRWRDSNGFRLPFRRLGICGNTSAGRQSAAALIEGEGIADLHSGTLFQASPKARRGQKVCVFCRAVLARKRFFWTAHGPFRWAAKGPEGPPEGFLFDAIKKKMGEELPKG